MSVVPIVDHPLDCPTAFTPHALVDAVRAERNLPVVPVPDVCILKFDGDLTDRLVADVEMQAASLFAFSAARGVPVGVVAHVTNAIDHCGDSFDKGAQDVDRLLLDAIGTAGGKLAGQA